MGLRMLGFRACSLGFSGPVEFQQTGFIYTKGYGDYGYDIQTRSPVAQSKTNVLLDSPGSPALKLMAYPVYPRYLLGAVQS